MRDAPYAVSITFILCTIGILQLFSPPVACAHQAELTISYSIPSAPITLHEPVVWRFRARNTSPVSIQLDLGKNREENFVVIYTGPDVQAPKTVQRQSEGFGIGGIISVAPNSAFERDLLLNQWINFNRPGRYDIEIKLVQPDSQGTTGRKVSPFRASVDLLAPNPRRLGEICKALVTKVGTASSYEEAAQAALELRSVRDPIAVPYLQQVLYAKKLVEPIAIDGLEQFGNQEAAKVLIDGLNRTSSDVAPIIRAALERMENRASDRKLKTLIQQALQAARASSMPKLNDCPKRA